MHDLPFNIHWSLEYYISFYGYCVDVVVCTRHIIFTKVDKLNLISFKPYESCANRVEMVEMYPESKLECLLIIVIHTDS